jgi:peptide-methionine (R)-S-oxide reductase
MDREALMSKKMLMGIVAWTVIGGALVANEIPEERKEAKRMMSEVEVYSVEAGGLVTVEQVTRSDDEWRSRLTPEQFRVVRGQGTERAFTGRYWDSKEEGVYRCAACGNDLFVSSAKFDSGTGWPSFSMPVHEANVGTEQDRKLWMVRTEVHCSRCGAHLGHVFPDGPDPTGLRYCINSVSLDFHEMALDDRGE